MPTEKSGQEAECEDEWRECSRFVGADFGAGEARDCAGMVLPLRIELRTSPLPRECSTTELRQHPGMRGTYTSRGRLGKVSAALGHQCGAAADLRPSRLTRGKSHSARPEQGRSADSSGLTRVPGRTI